MGQRQRHFRTGRGRSPGATIRTNYLGVKAGIGGPRRRGAVRAGRSRPAVRYCPRCAHGHGRRGRPAPRPWPRRATARTDAPARRAPAGRGGSRRCSSWRYRRPRRSNRHGPPAAGPDDPSSPVSTTAAWAGRPPAPPVPARMPTVKQRDFHQILLPAPPFRGRAWPHVKFIANDRQFHTLRGDWAT